MLWLEFSETARSQRTHKRSSCVEPNFGIAARRGEHIPATLFSTSTADDRVHPSHARRVVHKMRALGIGGKVLYHEMTEGGHAGAADNVARAKVKTIENRFLVDALKKNEA